MQLRVRDLRLPALPDADAVWGATGVDARGRIWVGVSGKRFGSSGHLLRYEPDADRWTVAGRVLDALARAGLAAPGQGQVKLHSRIVAASDGWLYFTSMDEEGEHEDGTALPRWGSHLWRVHPETGIWEHRLASADALIAVGAGGGSVFALGYWNHVLYHHDVVTGLTRRVVVGSSGGHVSRNLVVTANGRAFVPRVTEGGARAELVEFDVHLQERSAAALPGYAMPGDPGANHGITGLALGPGHQAWFTTHTGKLFAVDASSGGTARIIPLGDFHPAEGGYAPSLFLLDDGHTLAGVVQQGRRFDWVERNVVDGGADSQPFDTPGLTERLLYGSITRDHDGRFYLVGRVDAAAGGHRPVVLQVLRTKD
ncbi:MAG: hypothetical protein U1F52_04525 [Burkholderiales bacterium]